MCPHLYRKQSLESHGRKSQCGGIVEAPKQLCFQKTSGAKIFGFAVSVLKPVVNPKLLSETRM